MVAAGAVLGVIVSLLLTPQFKGNVILLVDQRQSKILDLGGGLSAPVDSSALRSEIDILTSRAVIDRVVDKLNLTDDPEFNTQSRSWKEWLNPFSFLRIRNSPKKTSRRNPEEKTATAKAVQDKLVVSNDGRSASIFLSFASRDPKRPLRSPTRSPKNILLIS